MKVRSVTILLVDDSDKVLDNRIINIASDLIEGVKYPWESRLALKIFDSIKELDRFEKVDGETKHERI